MSPLRRPYVSSELLYLPASPVIISLVWMVPYFRRGEVAQIDIDITYAERKGK